MAKKSTIEKYKRNQEYVARYKDIRTSLKETIRDPKTSDEEKFEASIKLQKLPRPALPVRLRHRCMLTGRARGNFRKFSLSRIKFRELAHRGLLPGVAKASW